jgi:serine/threonine protein kinase
MSGPAGEERERAERYQLGEPLGQGGQGRTFRSVDSLTGRTVAVKRIQLGGGGGWKAFDLFERECQVLRSLEHPAIPRYLDSFAIEEEGRYFLVMELVEGETLRKLLLEKQTLSEAQLWNILHQALEILDYLHGRGPPVIHRDLKPANLIRRPDGRLALVDFGGVRVALQPEGGSTMIGSFGYMAPEQLHGEATPGTDLYALGATLAALASGTEADKLPHQGLKIDLGAVLPASPLRELLSRLLEPDPTNRPGSVERVRALCATGSEAPSRDQAIATREEPEGEREIATLASEIGGPAGLVIRIFGSLGYVGLVLLDAMVLPIVVFVLGLAWGKHPRRLAQLRAREPEIRRAIRRGRKTMKALARSRHGKNPAQLPPAPRFPSLPPGPPQGRGRGRGRGRRQG